MTFTSQTPGFEASRRQARKRRVPWLRSLLTGVCCWGINANDSISQEPFQATIEAISPSDAGIDFIYTDGSNNKHYIMETVIGSLALFDYDNDGWIDIYLVNGSPLPGTPPNPNATNRLYRNLGNWRFRDVTEQAGVGDAQYGMGATVGDYDNDGDLDLFLSNFGENVFYVNEGDGTFTQSTEPSRLISGIRFGAGSVFVDIDLDGDLDLYSASYVEFAWDKHKIRTINGKEFSVGPNDYKPAKHFLYRNEGNGRFSDISNESGISAIRSPGMGVLSADFDDDGDMDLFVANDQKPNSLLVNDGKGVFTNEAILAGVGFDRNGRANGNMAVEYADMNNDGLLDFLTTTYQDEMPVYFECLGPGLYSDSTNIAKIDPKLFPHVKWGVGPIDFDHDGDLDLFYACGHFLTNLRFIDDRTDVKVQNFLLANNGRGRFDNVTDEAGDFLKIVESSRSAGFDDLDNDGDIDIVVLNTNAAPSLGRTRVTNQAPSLLVQLVGVSSNRMAAGAVVELERSDSTRLKHIVHAGRGYESHYGNRIHFGLGKTEPKFVHVKWPTGESQSFAIAPGTRRVLLIEGETTPREPSQVIGNRDAAK